MPYILRCFPHDDEAFAADAARFLAKFDGQAPSNDDGVPEDIAESLRVTYPNVTVNRSDELAAIGHVHRMLYVYRDGRPVVRRP